MSARFDLSFNYPDYVDAILDAHGSAVIGGSYIVDPDTANDIDIYVNQFDANLNAIIDAGYTPISDGHKKYPEIDHERLIAVYEIDTCDGPKANVIIVGAIFWAAYMGAINQMQMNPEQYRSREERIAIHKRYCSMVRDIAKGNA